MSKYALPGCVNPRLTTSTAFGRHHRSRDQAKDPFDYRRCAGYPIALCSAIRFLPSASVLPVLTFETDIRKVKAVDKLELRTYQDVVVFPRNGHRPLAGLLGGGDYGKDSKKAISSRKLKTF